MTSDLTIKDLEPGDILFYGKHKNFNHVAVFIEAVNDNACIVLHNQDISNETCLSIAELPFRDVEVIRCLDSKKVKSMLSTLKVWYNNGLEFSRKQAKAYVNRRLYKDWRAIPYIFKYTLSSDNQNYLDLEHDYLRLRFVYDKQADKTIITYYTDDRKKKPLEYEIPGNKLTALYTKAGQFSLQENKKAYDKNKYCLLKFAARRYLPSINKEPNSRKNGAICSSYILLALQRAYLKRAVGMAPIWASDKYHNLSEKDLANLPEDYKTYLLGLQSNKKPINHSKFSPGINFWKEDKFGKITSGNMIDDLLPVGLQLDPKTTTPRVLFWSLLADPKFKFLGPVKISYEQANIYKRVDIATLSTELNRGNLLIKYISGPKCKEQLRNDINKNTQSKLKT